MFGVVLQTAAHLCVAKVTDIFSPASKDGHGTTRRGVQTIGGDNCRSKARHALAAIEAYNSRCATTCGKHAEDAAAAANVQYDRTREQSGVAQQCIRIRLSAWLQGACGVRCP